MKMTLKGIRLLPKNLAGQFICLLLAALLLSQIITAFVFFKEREGVVTGLHRKSVINQIHATVRLLQESPNDLKNGVLRAASSGGIRFWLDPLPLSFLNSSYYKILDEPFTITLQDLGVSKVIELDKNLPRHISKKINMRTFNRGAAAKNWNHYALLLSDGNWLRVANRMHINPPFFRMGNMISIAITATILVLIVIFMVRRITKPLQRLNIAADELGRGERIEPVEISGPYDLRMTITSFNRMSERLERFVKDRTSMLAAISHDLRTPITTLRLRAELMDDIDSQAAFLATLDEMQAIVDSTLSFIRDDADHESMQLIDLVSLIDSLCENFRAQNKATEFEAGNSVFYLCRVVAMKRLLNNLLENAIKYGKKAKISIKQSDELLLIQIDDEGDGIPESQIEEIFTPFARLDKSRNKMTGGVGLGLSIARSIARSHGGDIKLENLDNRGLRAVLTLPI